MLALDRYGVRGLRTLLDDHGIVVLELELITSWWTTDAVRADSDRMRRDLLAAAGAPGARHQGRARCDGRSVGTRLPGDRVRRPGRGHYRGRTRIGLEFLPWSNIKTAHGCRWSTSSVSS
jgi:hypothetical protein